MIDISQSAVCGNVVSDAHVRGARLPIGETEHTSTQDPYRLLSEPMNQKHLLRKMQSAQATRRIWIDEQAEPYPEIGCWCGGTMELDYEQGYELMTQRLSQWLNSHAECEPKEEEQAS